MIVHEMTLQDLPSVAELAAQLGYPEPVEAIQARFAAMSNDPRYGLFVAKSPDGRVIGWVQINTEPMSLLIGPRADIAALVVDESARREGVGKSLVQRAETWAREGDLDTVRVHSNSKRHDAHRFYQREGYELMKTSHVFAKKLAQQACKETGVR